MSYNIDNIDTPVLDAWMEAKDIVSLIKKGQHPEISFLEDLEDAAREAVWEGKFDKKIVLKELSWSGEGAGRSYEDFFVKKVAPKIHGKVEAIVTWEGGDSFSAFAIEDGEFEECDVEMKVVRRGK